MPRRTPVDTPPWTWWLIKAGAGVASENGSLPGPSGPYTETVANALGGCMVAAFDTGLYVAATAISGWGRCSQYARSAQEAFALAP